jgi:hypothetical protein
MSNFFISFVLGWGLAMVMAIVALVLFSLIQYGTWHPYGDGGRVGRRERRK